MPDLAQKIKLAVSFSFDVNVIMRKVFVNLVSAISSIYRKLSKSYGPRLRLRSSEGNFYGYIIASQEGRNLEPERKHDVCILESIAFPFLHLQRCKNGLTNLANKLSLTFCPDYEKIRFGVWHGQFERVRVWILSNNIAVLIKYIRNTT